MFDRYDLLLLVLFFFSTTTNPFSFLFFSGGMKLLNNTIDVDAASALKVIVDVVVFKLVAEINRKNNKKTQYVSLDRYGRPPIDGQEGKVQVFLLSSAPTSSTDKPATQTAWAKRSRVTEMSAKGKTTLKKLYIPGGTIDDALVVVVGDRLVRPIDIGSVEDGNIKATVSAHLSGVESLVKFFDQQPLLLVGEEEVETIYMFTWTIEFETKYETRGIPITNGESDIIEVKKSASIFNKYMVAYSSYNASQIISVCPEPSSHQQQQESSLFECMQSAGNPMTAAEHSLYALNNHFTTTNLKEQSLSCIQAATGLKQKGKKEENICDNVELIKALRGRLVITGEDTTVTFISSWAMPL